MSKNKTPTNNPSIAQQCHERRHMTLSEFVVYDVARAWSSTPSPDPKYKGKNILYFNGPKIAAESAALCTATVYRVRDSLAKKGWLDLVQKSYWVDGKRTAAHYRVIHHEEWEKKHGKQCAQTKAAKYAQRAVPDDESHSHHENTSSHHENLPSHHENTSSHHENLPSHHVAIACKDSLCLEPVKTACVPAGSAPCGVAALASLPFNDPQSLGTHTDSEAQPEGHSHSENNSKSHSHSENNSTPEPKPVVKVVYEPGIEDYAKSLGKWKAGPAMTWALKRLKQGTPTTLEDMMKQYPVMEGVTA